MSIIEIKNLSHRFENGTMGLDNINLSIEKGTLTLIAGRNGSGKTTLLRHLNGLLLPEKGSVLLNHVPVSKNLKRARQMVGMMFQDADSQIVGETVSADVAFGPENLCLDKAEVDIRVNQSLRAVGLENYFDQRPHLLSGGEKRRLAIAGVLAMEPDILVFDEPFSGLDYPGVKQVLEQIVSLHKTGHTILVTTHDIEKIIAHADRLIIMNNGKIIKDGVPDEIVPGSEEFGVREPCLSHMGVRVRSWLD